MWWIRHKETKQRLEITLRIACCRDWGKYGMGYLSEARVIQALKTSGILYKQGLSYRDFELVNINGRTMEEMRNWPVEAGFALRHRSEKWYWNAPANGRVWYKRAGDAQAAWTRNEQKQFAEQSEFRKKLRTCPSQERLMMVRGDSQGNVVEMPNWL
jgi:hypothetical protein